MESNHFCNRFFPVSMLPTIYHFPVWRWRWTVFWVFSSVHAYISFYGTGKRCAAAFLQFFYRYRESVKRSFIGVGKAGFFLIPLILLLPLRFGIMGILLAGPVADCSAFVLSVVLVGIELRKQKNAIHTNSMWRNSLINLHIKWLIISKKPWFTVLQAGFKLNLLPAISQNKTYSIHLT